MAYRLLHAKRAGAKNPYQNRLFTADNMHVHPFPKIVRVPFHSKGTVAEGAHGTAYDLVVFKGAKTRNLVVKRFHGHFNQEKTAYREFLLFSRLKQKGYPVPPTVRLVSVDGKLHVAMTDLTKFGDLQIRKPISIHNDLSPILGKKNALEIMEFIRETTDLAYQEEGISLGEAWEVVVNTSKKTAKPFIVDLTMNGGVFKKSNY